MTPYRPAVFTLLAVVGTGTVASAQPAVVGPRTLDIARHKQHTIYRMAFSPDGAVLAIAGYPLFRGSGSEVLTLWSVPTGRHLRTLHGDAGGERFDFSPDGKLLATPLEQAGEVVLWEVATGKESRRLKHPGVDEVKFSPAGKHLYSSNWPIPEPETAGDLRVWEFGSGEQIFSAAWDARGSRTFARFSTDGRLFFGDSYSRVRCWEPVTGVVRPPVRYAPPGEIHVGLSPRGDLVTGASNKTDRLRLRDAATGKVRHDLGKMWVDCTEFTHDGKLLVVGLDKGRIELWDTVTGARRSAFQGPESVPGAFHTVMPFPDGRHVLIRDAFLGSDGSGVFQNTVVYTLDGRLVRRAPEIHDIAVDPSVRTVAVLEWAPTAADQPRELRVMLYDAASWLAGGAK